MTLFRIVNQSSIARRQPLPVLCNNEPNLITHTMKTNYLHPVLVSAVLIVGVTRIKAQLPTLDPVFAGSGVLDVPIIGSLHDCWAANLLALQDGSYLGISEVTLSVPEGYSGQGVLVKFDQCGTFDPDFGTAGVSQLAGAADWRVLPEKGVELANGSFLLAGTTNQGFGAVSTNRHTAIRVLPNGTLDAAYGMDGFIRHSSSDGVASSYGMDLIALPTGGYVAAAVQSGNSNGGSRALSLFGYQATGDPDAAFGTDGVVHVPKSEFAYRATTHLTSSSTILVAYGRRFVNTIRIELSAFTLAGEPSTTFGSNGVVDDTTAFSGVNGYFEDFAAVLDDQDRLTVMGTLDQDNIMLIRFLPSGARDLTFGVNGRLLVPHLGTNLPPLPSRLKILADGNILGIVHAGTSGNVPGTQWFLLNESNILANDDQPWVSLGFKKASDAIEIEEGRWLVLSGAQFPAGMAVRRFSMDPVALPSISASGSSLITAGSGPGFQWYLDGSEITGATTNSFEPLSNGSYTVEMTDALGCSAISAPFELLNVGVPTTDPTQSISLTGPDAYGMLTIRSDDSVPYELFDARGLLLKTGTITAGYDQISTIGLASGSYTFVLRSPNGRKVFRFFAK